MFLAYFFSPSRTFLLLLLLLILPFHAVLTTWLLAISSPLKKFCSQDDARSRSLLCSRLFIFNVRMRIHICVLRCPCAYRQARGNARIQSSNCMHTHAHRHVQLHKCTCPHIQINTSDTRTHTQASVVQASTCGVHRACDLKTDYAHACTQECMCTQQPAIQAWTQTDRYTDTVIDKAT